MPACGDLIYLHVLPHFISLKYFSLYPDLLIAKSRLLFTSVSLSINFSSRWQLYFKCFGAVQTIGKVLS